MFEILKSEAKVFDKIRFHLITGRDVEVEIIEIGDNYVLAKDENGTQSRLFAQIIGGWDLISLPATTTAKSEPVESELTKESELPSNTLGLKIVGKIDLDSIKDDRRKKADATRNSDGTQTASLSQHINHHKTVYSSLQNLKELTAKIDESSSNQLVPANAVLKRYLSNYKYGFITDNEGKDYHFHINDVYDDKLKSILANPESLGTHLVCVLNTTFGKTRATSIYQPKTIDEFQILANSYYTSKNFVEAQTVVGFILSTIDSYEPALLLRDKIALVNKSVIVDSTSASPIYFQAKAELKRGNTEYGKRLLLELVEKPNSRSEAALKELSYELQREGKLEDAIQLVSKYKQLIKTSDPNSLLAYFYETKRDYAVALTYLQKVKPQTPIERIKLDKRLAIGYFQIKDYDQSEIHLKKVIDKHPNDFAIQKLLDALAKIKSEGLSDELETIFNEAELSSLSGGRSAIMTYAIQNCDYAGVPAAIVSEEKFTKTTLRELRKFIEEAGKARPKERASYLLTEAKLIELIEPEREEELSSVLSRYSLAISQHMSSEGNPIDVIRFYLLEAFKLASSIDKVRSHLPIYIYSFQLSSFESYKMLNKSFDETFKDVFANEITTNFWNGLMDLFMTNTEIFSQILTRLYQNPSYIKACVNFLSNYLKNVSIGSPSKESFSKLWNEAVDKRRREKEAFSSKFLSLGKSKNTESFAEAFNGAKHPIPTWIGNLDRHRVNSIDDIFKTLYEFNTQASFEDKERYFNIVGSQINTLHTEIESSPTEFSFNILRPQLEILSKLVDKEFKAVILTSKPVITLKVLGESIIHDNNLVVVSFNVANRKGSAPISWFAIDIISSDGIESLQEQNENNQSLRGGDDKTLKLKVQVSKRIREQGAFNLEIKFSYKIRGGEHPISFNENLAIRLYSEIEFDEIGNPFAATADSGPVQDERMFYGREEFIENIQNSILESSSKCVIIYGQKRSGKSSVLFHLKKKLNQSYKTFCISFSLGEIVEDLSAQTFYYKVLSEIEDSLESITIGEEVKPHFSSPALADLKEAPSLIFNEYMKGFQKECNRIKDWQNINLVLLIDEFTYIYTAIQKGFLSDQFMKTWKSFVEKSFFTSILIGQDIMPKFKMAYQNEFGIAEDKRLSYLSREEAIKLIEEPIWDEKRNRSRYLGKATDLILDYTSSNPYYIQIFCARLVDYMNSQKAISITEADVYDVAQTFIRGEQSLSADKFDNLITAGDADVEAFNPQDILWALREIALASKNLDSCSRESIRLGDKGKEDLILSDLKTREVISSPQQGFYKIKVRLFKEWLLNN